MAFNNDDFQAPEKLRTDGFLLRPIRAADAELDYEAVMESKAFLRQWEQSSWPEDDFTVEANREDSVKLERRHTDGESFTYTVMNPTETQCLGCVYIFPTAAPVLQSADLRDRWCSVVRVRGCCLLLDSEVPVGRRVRPKAARCARPVARA